MEIITKEKLKASIKMDGEHTTITMVKNIVVCLYKIKFMDMADIIF
jgi:hypothetical protein